ncbi:MAG: T9SS type A sorting domain-containing protein [Bacteroidia bacterium]|nr:T9SS type A sorting domain-containing protein [Bacteroidia bacterium]
MRFFKNKTNKTFLFLIIGFISITNPAFSQAWQWANSLGGSNSDVASLTCTDPSGNVFVTGTFSGVSMNIGTVSIANAGGSDVFVAKFDANGNYIWSQRIAGTGQESVNGICSDAAGRVYVTGSFDSPSITVSPLSVSNYTNFTSDAYVACFDGFGSPQWLRKYGGSGNETGGGVAYTNTQSSLYMTGYFNTPNLAIGTTTLANASTSGATFDIFLIKLSSFGNPTWALRTGGSASNDYGHSVSIDASNSYPYVAGSFSPTSTLTPTSIIGTTTLTSYGGQDLFVSKFTDVGGFSWARGSGGSSTSGVDYFGELAVDASNNPYITGYYFGTPYTIGTTTLAYSGGYDAFVAKYNSAGTLQWANKVMTGNALNEDTRSIATDGNNNVYVCGSFAGTVVTTGAGNLTNSNPGTTTEAFVVKYNSAGVAQWATSANGSSNEYASGIASDAVGNVYVAGYYNIAGPTAFGTTTLNSAGGNDGFYSKIGCLTTTLTGPSNVCTGSSATLTASGASSYTWSTGATTSSIVIAPSTNTVYSVTGSSATCVGTPGSLTITVLPASLNAGSSLNLLCKQKAVISATCNPTATLVTWSPATNLSSSSVLTPTVTAATGATNYTVTTTLSNGCVKTGTVNVSSYAQTPDICQVTVDSLSVYNEIYWDKTLYPQADSFVVYREVSTNTYTRIAAISRTAMSMYIDTNRSIGPANGNPNLTYYKYKLQVKDSCGNASALSLWHETIFIQDQLNGNFNWNMYSIESTTTTPVSNYNLKRRDLAIGTETIVTSTTGGLASDPQYNTVWPTNIKWFVDAVGFSCNATAKTMVLKTKTKSNQSNDKQFIGVKELEFDGKVILYPNPANDVLNVDLNSLPKTETTTEIRNTLGQLVYQTKSLNQHLVINTSSLAGGVYIVNIKQNNNIIAVKKVVINK